MKFFTPLSLVLIITLIAVFILAPDWTNVVAGVAVLLGLSIVLFAVVQKHIRHRQSQPVNKLTTARNITVEMAGILLAMIVAGLIGRFVSEAATSQINDELTKLVTGIFIGVLIGLGTGFLVRRVWGRLMEIVS